MLNSTTWIAALACVVTASAQAQAPATSASGPRWIHARAVNLRAQASPHAEVLTRMAVNTKVELIARTVGTPYCEIDAEVAGNTVKGFTACEYLGQQPLDLQKLGWRDEQGEILPHYDAAKAFSISPTWDTLASHANYLEQSRLTPEQRDNPMQGISQDAELERMKAHLAKGIHGPAPTPLADWASMKNEAAAVVRRQAPADAPAASAMQRRLGAYQIEFVEARPELIVHLVNAIELPRARASMFKDEAEIAPPQEDVTAISGRFHIIHKWRTRPRTVSPEYGSPGVWDIKDARASLVQPVMAITLYRDGRLQSAPGFATKTFPLYSELQEMPGCHDYQDGFSFGDADPAIWGDPSSVPVLPGIPKNSLLKFHLRDAPAQAAARLTVTHQKLDRATTGLVRATMLSFDLDHDGEPDLVAWEGVGHGPGHLEGRTETDDAWYRVFFVNIAGRWKVLGSDQFGYGCGC